MKLNVMFIIAAIALVLISLLSLLTPAAPTMLGIVGVGEYFYILVAAVGWLALAVIAWLVRNAEPSKTRDAVVLGYTLLFAVWAVISLIGQFGPFAALPSHSGSWVIALIQALIAVGFFVAGRANMSAHTT